MRKNIFTLLVLAVLLTMVQFASAQTGGYSSYGSEPDASANARVLLNQLAMVQQFLPQDRDQINPTGYSSNYIFVRPLLREIYLEGKNALPALAEFFDNENYLYSVSGIASMALGEVAKVTVGTTAKNIFHEIINPVPYGSGYEAKVPSRIGADGKEYRGPVFGTFSITKNCESALQWLQQNANKSLTDIQRDVVDFYIHEEIKIGFPNEESYQRYLVPLLNLRANLPHVDNHFHNVVTYVPVPPTTSKSQSKNEQPKLRRGPNSSGTFPVLN